MSCSGYKRLDKFLINDVSGIITMVIEDGDAAELAHALGVAAKARGMSEVAKATGITREALYKALKPNAKPRFDIINKVCAALGVRLIAQPANTHWTQINFSKMPADIYSFASNVTFSFLIFLMTTVPAILSCSPCFLLSIPTQINPRNKGIIEM